MKMNIHTIKSFLLIATYLFAHSFCGARERQITNLDNLSTTTQESITKQTYDFNLYDETSNEKIANLSYRLENETTIYLEYIKIYSRENRGEGLGKQLFTYFVNHVQERNPKITTIKWQAYALDPEYLSQEALEKWYKARGGVRVGPYPFGGGSLFTLDVKKFKSEPTISAVLALDIRAEFKLKGATEIELKNRNNICVAKLGYLLSTKQNKYIIDIENLIINPSYTTNKAILEQRLRQSLISHLQSKKWLTESDFRIKTNYIIPNFTL